MSHYGHEFPGWGSRCVHCGRLDPDHGECPARLRQRVDRLERILATASTFTVKQDDARGDVRVEAARQIDGSTLWAVRLRGYCLSRSGEWAFEPIPSSRDAAFLAEHRWPDRDEAIEAATAALEDEHE